MSWLRRRWRSIVLALTVTVAAPTIWGFGIEPAMLDVEQVRLGLPRLDPALDGLEVAVLSDLHIGAPHIDLDKLDRVVDEVKTREPDVVVLLGDYVTTGMIGSDFVEPETIARHLEPLTESTPVFAVLGNHDWWFDGERVRRALQSVDIVVLEDAAQPLRLDGATLWLAGLSDLMTRSVDIEEALAAVPADASVVLLTHNPDVFPDVPDRVALTLAGHTHGGQVHVPGYGPPIVPSRYGQRYARGHIVESGRHLWVSVGVGTSIIPVRFLVTPSIDVLTLRTGPHRGSF